jgi:hypothetical protein
MRAGTVMPQEDSVAPGNQAGVSEPQIASEKTSVAHRLHPLDPNNLASSEIDRVSVRVGDDSGCPTRSTHGSVAWILRCFRASGKYGRVELDSEGYRTPPRE